MLAEVPTRTAAFTRPGWYAASMQVSMPPKERPTTMAFSASVASMTVSASAKKWSSA